MIELTDSEQLSAALEHIQALNTRLAYQDQMISDLELLCWEQQCQIAAKDNPLIWKIKEALGM